MKRKPVQSSQIDFQRSIIRDEYAFLNDKFKERHENSRKNQTVPGSLKQR